MTTNERALYIYKKLRQAGMTYAGAIGMIGNLQGETADLSPMRIENSYLKKFGITIEEYVRRADNDEVIYNGKMFIKDSAGFGIAQWTYWSRKQNLLNYAKSQGKSVGDLDIQIEFLLKEIQESYSSVWKVCSTTTDYSKAVKSCVSDYEKPANQGEATERRTSYAKNWAAIISESNYSDTTTTVVEEKTEEIKTETKVETETTTIGFDRRKVIALAQSEVGYLEKKTNDQLDDKTANAGSNNYTKYARDLDNIGDFYNGKKNGYAWCDVFVDWLFVQCFGVDNALDLLCASRKSSGAGCTYSLNYFIAKNQYHTRKEKPEVGDQIFFGSVGNSNHTGIVYKVDDTYVYTIEGNTSGASGVISNGGGVCAKQYLRTLTNIAGYGRPAYNDGFTGDSVETGVVEEKKEEVKEGTKVEEKTETETKVEEKVEETTSTIKAGDLVTVKSGATWYSGGKVSSWILAKKWYVLQVNGDRAVINKSEDGSQSIMSPINVSYLTLVTAASATTTTTVKKDNVDPPTPSKTQFDRQKLLDVALAEVGYLEKKTESQLDDRTANAGEANFNKYARDLDAIPNYYYHDRKQGLNWCDIFCDWCFVQAYGVDDSFTVNCQPQYSYGAGCGQSMAYYKAKGRLDMNPQVGDQFFLSDGLGSTGHTGLVVGVNSDGSVVTVEGNQAVRDGVEGVVKKGRALWDIAGFGHPMYNDGYGTDDYIGKTIDPEPIPDPEPVEQDGIILDALQKGSKGVLVKNLQLLLKGNGYSVGLYGTDGDFGSATENAVKKFQKKVALPETGICDMATWEKLLKG
jgi:ribosomal protein L24